MDPNQPLWVVDVVMVWYSQDLGLKLSPRTWFVSIIVGVEYELDFDEECQKSDHQSLVLIIKSANCIIPLI